MSEVMVLDRSRAPSTGGVFAGRQARAHRATWILPAAACLVVVVAGMAYSLWWSPVIGHGGAWVTPGDLWGTFRAAHVVGWGGEGILYDSGLRLVTFPGIAVLLAPVAMISSGLHLTESYPWPLTHPTAWLLLGPVDLLLGSVLLVPLDQLVRRLGIGGAQRTAAMAVGVLIVWPSVALWGHPEDPLALAFGIWGLLGAFDGRWRRCAGMFAVAMALQPLTLVIVPLAAVLVHRRHWAAMAGIVATPSLALVVAPFVHAWHATLHALVDQPNYPTIDHATPWVALAPVVVYPPRISRTAPLPRAISSVLPPASHPALAVAAGPGRLIAVALALAVALIVASRRVRPTLPQLVWAAAVALALRCIFEAVMVPYYLLPALALAVVVSAIGGWRRLLPAAACTIGCTLASYRDTGEWAYYLPVVLLLVATLWVSMPSARRIAVPEPVDVARGSPQPAFGD